MFVVIVNGFINKRINISNIIGKNFINIFVCVKYSCLIDCFISISIAFPVTLLPTFVPTNETKL